MSGWDVTDAMAQQTTEFQTERMKNAHYWAAQARGFMDEQVHGLEGEHYVEIQAGQAIIVMSDEFPEGGIDGLENELHDHGFPADWTRRELPKYNETRLFIQPTRDRLKSNFVDDWQEFENGEYGE